MTTLLIDNFDSFTWNVYQALSILGAKVKVVRNNEISLEEAIQMNPRNLVISPGPGYPSTAGLSTTLIRHFQGKIPILGVCLGEQAMFELYGGKVVPCGELVHGKTTPIMHDGNGVFCGVSQNIECTRYHSLAGSLDTLPEVLKVTAWTANGIIMGVRHKEYCVEGVQFHPESIVSEQGNLLFNNFLQWEGGTWDRLVLRPDLVSEVVKHESKMDLSHGIPIEMAKKMNSTAAPMACMISSPSILEKICSKRKQRVAMEKLQIGQSMAYLERSYSLAVAPSVISIHKRILKSVDSYGVAVLAEIKRASPSKHNIDISAHAPQQACLYASGGAAAISVLTEPDWFKGNLDDLTNARMAIDKIPSRPAILRKDFIFDSYQILQARLAGADSVLLIVAVLEISQLKELMEYSRNLGMEPLVEVASEAEMERAISCGALIIGVNNRDLNTFTVDPLRTRKLSKHVMDPSTILLALSGINTRDDVLENLAAGAKGVLVGEALMKSESKPLKIKELLGISDKKIEAVKRNFPLVKICGLTNVEDTMFAIEYGADLVGFIFEKSSPRYVHSAVVKAIVSEAGLLHNQMECRTEGLNHSPIPANQWFRSLTSFPPHRPLTVGVFTDHTVEEINSITNQCGLDLIQCHSFKNATFHRLLNRPSIQVLSIDFECPDSLETLLTYSQRLAGSCTALMLDTSIKGLNGGTGKAFDWNLVQQMNDKGIPVLMAGGITVENVMEALRFHPLGIDVSSGVEVAKGKKDPTKLRALLNMVKKQQ